MMEKEARERSFFTKSESPGGDVHYSFNFTRAKAIVGTLGALAALVGSVYAGVSGVADQAIDHRIQVQLQKHTAGFVTQSVLQAHIGDQAEENARLKEDLEAVTKLLERMDARIYEIWTARNGR